MGQVARRLSAVAVGLSLLVALGLGAPAAQAVVPDGYERADPGDTGVEVDVTITDLTATSLCARMRMFKNVGAATETVTLGDTALDGIQGEMLTDTGLEPQEPVVSTKVGESYTIAEREDCWTETPTEGDSTFTIMGAGLDPFTVVMDMRRAVDTNLGISRLPEDNPICADRRVRFRGGIAALAQVLYGSDQKSAFYPPEPVPVRIQFKRMGTDRWVTQATDMTDPVDGGYSWRHRVDRSGKWRARFNGAFIEPLKYRPSLSKTLRIDVRTCV